MNPISGVIIVKNGERHIKEVLSTLAPLREVVLYDNGSTDRTLEIASGFPNVHIVRGEFRGFGKTKQAAIARAKQEWVFCIDADEVPTPELVTRILNMPLEEDCGYLFCFENHYNGRAIRCCGWDRDEQLVLFHRKSANFEDAEVHEKVVALPGKSLKLIHCPEKLIHYPYHSIEDFLHKMQHYSTLFAKQNAGKKQSSLTKALLRGWWTFFKKYLLQRGFLEGREGFIISLYNAQSTFWKYAKLMEANERLKQRKA